MDTCPRRALCCDDDSYFRRLFKGLPSKECRCGEEGPVVDRQPFKSGSRLYGVDSQNDKIENDESDDDSLLDF